MLIDWFTVVAQIVNFLILVWLLKRFLYKPILNAIDTREKKIAKELGDADLKKAEALKERDEFQRKNEEFDQQRAALIEKATQEAQSERQRLLDEARQAADNLSAKRHQAMLSDAHNLNQELSQRTRQEVFAIARKTLTDLAAASLEERVAGVFIRRLHELDEQARANLGEAFKSASSPALLRSAFDLAETQRVAIRNALNETLSTDITLRFETAPELISGIELTANGQKIAWSISDYLAGLGKSVDELLKEKDKADADAKAKTESNLAAKIGKRAYELYEKQGRKEGQAFKNWDAAEREIRSGIPDSNKVVAKPETNPETEVEPATPAAAPEEYLTVEPDSLQNVLDNALTEIGHARETFTPRLAPREVGTITSVATGIAMVSGLPGVSSEEVLKFPGDIYGIAFNVDEKEIGVVLLGDYAHLQAGFEVERRGHVVDVPVGEGLIGRIINPMGHPLDGNGPVASSARLPVERPSAPIMDRAPVTVPLQTGIKVIDALIPVGHGQRELILGDRQTGKTAIAIDTILNQRGQNVLCVYCAIGQRASGVAKVIAALRENGALEYTVVVVTEGNDPPGLAYIAPYAATSIAEYFMEQGRDVLIVYDDLTHHARAYRELSLLLRRPPGREAFPGDIFYIHSRLLERATHLLNELGGGSLTALPIIETEAQDISAYIPTNLISITDGQIYLSPSLFELGVLPAVDVGKSVSRVGGKAQRAAYRAVAGDLKLAYAQFEEMETFAKFGARLDDDTRLIIDHGRRIRSCLKQPELAPVPVPAQIAVLLALTAKLFDNVPLDKMKDAEHAVHKAAADIPAEICTRLDTADKLSDEDRKQIIDIASQALASFQPKPEAKPEARPGTETNTTP